MNISNIIKKMFGETKAALNIMSVAIDVALVVALIPVIKTFIGEATNLTSAETVLLGLTTLVIVVALIYSVVKQSGLMHNK